MENVLYISHLEFMTFLMGFNLISSSGSRRFLGVPFTRYESPSKPKGRSLHDVLYIFVYVPGTDATVPTTVVPVLLVAN